MRLNIKRLIYCWLPQLSWFIQVMSWGNTSWAALHLSLYPVIFTHAHKNVFGSAPHAFKNPSTTVRQMPSIWQPLCDCGKKWTKASVFHHTAALLEICLDLIVLLLKSVKAPCSSRSLRKVLLDDAWADVSSFRGNGERIGRKRWAPLNTAGEVDLAPGGVRGDWTQRAERSVFLFKHYDDEFYVIPNHKFEPLKEF